MSDERKSHNVLSEEVLKIHCLTLTSRFIILCQLPDNFAEVYPQEDCTNGLIHRTCRSQVSIHMSQLSVSIQVRSLPRQMTKENDEIQDLVSVFSNSETVEHIDI